MDLDVVVPTAGDQIRFNPDNETKDLKAGCALQE